MKSTRRLLLLFLIVIPAFRLAAADVATDRYTVTYTGRLLGAFRIPEVQESSQVGCPALNPGTDVEAARFQAALDLVKDPLGTTVRVALGNNFAPFFVGRKMHMEERSAEYDGSPKPEDFPLSDKAHWEYNPADRKWWYDGAKVDGYLAGTGKLATDNIICFLQAMGFDAVVPGARDFYYGPERLRELARLLRTFQTAAGQNRQMLGANLYMQARYLSTSTAQGAPAGAGAEKTRKREPDATLVFPKVALPWMRSVTVKDPKGEVQRVCLLALPENAAAKDNAHSKDCSGAGAILFASQVNRKGSAPGVSEYWMSPDADPISPGRYGAFALGEKNAELGSATVNIQFPFFEYPADSQTKPRLNDMKPWVIRGGEKGSIPVAIFGVVSSTLMQSVGQLNSLWLYRNADDSDKHREVDVLVSDPAEALKQVFDYCQQVPECRGARKVLLAQMPQQELYQVTGHIPLAADALPVDLALAQVDPDRPGEERTVLRKLPENRTGPAAARPVVLTPGSRVQADHPYRYTPVVQSAEVVPEFAEDSAVKQTVENRVFAGDPIDLGLFPPMLRGNKTLSCVLGSKLDHKPSDNFESFLHLAFLNTGPCGPQDWRSGLEQLALYTMREACHSDIAVLQHRSLVLADDFANEKLNDLGMRQLFAALFPEGDLVLCKQITGSDLNTLLKQSKQYQEDEDNGLLAESMRGSSLAVLGANDTAAEETKREINGQLIDLKRLYSIAIQDILIGGQAGYSAFTVDPPPVTPLSETVVRTLAPLVAKRLLDGRKEAETTARKGKDAVDEAQLKSAVPGGRAFIRPEPVKQPGFRDWFINGLPYHIGKSPCGPARKGIVVKGAKIDGCAEDFVQQRPLWWVMLYKADLSLAQFLHGYSEAVIAQQFQGISQVSLSAAEYKSISADYSFRIEHDTRHFVKYFQSVLNYGDRLQRQTQPNSPAEPYIASQTANYWYQELGLGYRLLPHRDAHAGWKAVVAAGFQSQPAHPFVPFSISSYLPPGSSSSGGGGSGGSASNPIESRRTIFPTGRVGLRYDFAYPKSNASQAGAGGGGAGAGASAGGASSGGGSGGGKKGGGQSSQQGGSGGGASSGQGQSQTYNTFIEFGYEHGNLYHGVSSYLLQAPTAAGTGFVAQCGVDDLACLQTDALIAQSLKGGVGTLQRVYAHREHQQQGMYFNFRIDGPMPVLSSAEFVLENRGDWFAPRHGDLSIDTRLSSDFKASVIVPFWKKFNLSPSVESILFQAQSTRNFYHSFSTSVSLNYSFEWHPGIGFRRALLYNNPTPTQPTLPVK